MVEGRVTVSEDGRRLLREAAASLGLDIVIGNKIADWLDAHPNAEVSISGRTPEPPLRVFGTPDVDRTPKRVTPFTEDPAT